MPADAPQSDRRGLGWTGGAHIAALWALAVAGPIYDVLRQNAEFFVAYRTTRADALLFVAAVSVVLPAVLWALVGLIGLASATLGRAALTTVLGALVAILSAQALQPLSPPTYLHIAMAAGFGLLAAALYAAPVMRMFTTCLSPAVVAFPLIFLSSGSISPLLWPPHEDPSIAVAPGPTTPIVLVVFDQLPLTSLLAADETIDSASYPGFGELASMSTWFRHATTVGELTTWALPPIVSGEFPAAGRLPSAAGYPRNLFTTLRRAYAMKVFEPITTLCPDAICRPAERTQEWKVEPMLADAGVVLLHRIAPPALAAGLPSVTENWRGFAAAQGFQRRWAGARDHDRREVLGDFIGAISRTDPEPTLYFLHALLPHEPYEYLPSGQDSGRLRSMAGLSGGRWTRQEWPVVQAYARHLLQVAYVDRFVQRLLTRLRTEGLLDKALVVVTADHGVSFVRGRGMKALTRTTAPGIVPVPLFVKRPFQRAGEKSLRNVQSVDVFPAIADAIGVRLPFAVEGRSPFATEQAAPAEKTVAFAGGGSRLLFGPNGPQGQPEAVASRIRWFGDGPAPYWNTRVDPVPELRGRSLDGLRIGKDPNLRVTFDTAEDLVHVDPAGDLVPALISGRIRGSVGRSTNLDLAIAVNGRIEATSATYHDLDSVADGSWTALVNPSVYKKGFNDVRVFVVRRDGGTPQLIEVFRTSPP